MVYSKLYRAMMGAFVGDAAGATLEFMGRIIPEMARNAMKMPGGGNLDVGPGQITDDGELTLAAWQHISRFTDGFGIPVSNLMRAYTEWYRSNPYDMGRTCSIGFGQLCKVVPRSSHVMPLNTELKDEVMKNIEKYNKQSEANGALMRATALATWVTTIVGDVDYSNNSSVETLISSIAELDAKLSHPNQVCVDVNKIYVYILYGLLNGLSPKDVLLKIELYVEKEIKSEKVKKWFFEESLNIDGLDCMENCGHVRYGFVMAIYFLRNPHINYEEAIYKTLLKGGDTDTNACIVGGLVGCYQEIPDYMLKPVIEFDCTKKGQIRPENYSVKNLLNGTLSKHIYDYYNPN